MEKKSFFQTKEGGLTLAFFVIMIAFFVILVGLKTASDVICTVGFVLIVAAMLYSPVKVYLLKK